MNIKFQFPINSFHFSLIALVFSLAIYRFFVTDSGDRYHCHALLNDGRWLDSRPASWQPEGCMLHPYSPKDVKKCIAGRHVVFIGDSSVRNIFYAAVKHVDRTIDTSGEKHSDRVIVLDGMRFSFYWDPFLNGTATEELLAGTISEGGVPSLAVVGSGVWYLRHPTAGGLPEWKDKIASLFAATSNSNRIIADEVVLIPVGKTVEALLSPDRAMTIRNDDIQEMNEHLDFMLRSTSITSRPTLAIPRVFNQLIEGFDDETTDGLHFSNSITTVQASILYNLRCNDVAEKKFPFDKTCCSQYPIPNWIQVILLLLLLGYAPAGMYYHSKTETSPSTIAFFPDQKYLLPLAIFGFSASLLFISDRTSFFLKENKQYSSLNFLILSLVALVAGFLTLTPQADKDLGWLNREQTDEWKGWMQIAILIYHYLGASKISGIYNPIRVLVAAYLFMSGYGHLNFFLKKANYGFSRVANVLVRINLLTVVLSYLMDTDYLSYYFSPLVTLWFLIIWITMWAGNQHNENTTFLLSKIAITSILTACYFSFEGPLELTFSIINTLFSSTWNAKEWRFRVALDLWIVWIGMLTAFGFIKIKQLNLMDRPEWSQWQSRTIIASAGSMIIYLIFELTREDKFIYNLWHPYISFLPILAFCVLRNSTVWLRSTNSKLFMFFGKCSLETFIVQFHLFIAADTKGIIMMIPGGDYLRPLNFIITSLIFVYISDQIAIATGSLTEFICSTVGSASGTRLPTSRNNSASTAAGGGDSSYTPLPLSGSGDQEEKVADLSSEDASSGGGGSLLSRVGDYAKRDLRIKFGLIFLGLWVLNWIYPA